MAGRTTQERPAGSPGGSPGNNGRSAPCGSLRPDVGGCAHVNRAKSAERTGVRQEECGDIHRVREGDLSICGYSNSANLSIEVKAKKAQQIDCIVSKTASKSIRTFP